MMRPAGISLFGPKSTNFFVTKPMRSIRHDDDAEQLNDGAEEQKQEQCADSKDDPPAIRREQVEGRRLIGRSQEE